VAAHYGLVGSHDGAIWPLRRPAPSCAKGLRCRQRDSDGNCNQRSYALEAGAGDDLARIGGQTASTGVFVRSGRSEPSVAPFPTIVSLFLPPCRQEWPRPVPPRKGVLWGTSDGVVRASAPGRRARPASRAPAGRDEASRLDRRARRVDPVLGRAQLAPVRVTPAHARHQAACVPCSSKPSTAESRAGPAPRSSPWRARRRESRRAERGRGGWRGVRRRRVRGSDAGHVLPCRLRSLGSATGSWL